MPKTKFVRRDSGRFSKLGKGRKKLQKWRKAKGRDNKIREKRHGYPKMPSVGYKKPISAAGKISGLKPVTVRNIKDLEKTDKSKEIIIIGKVGARKKLEIIKRATELKLSIMNVNSKESTNAAK